MSLNFKESKTFKWLNKGTNSTHDAEKVHAIVNINCFNQHWSCRIPEAIFCIW